MSMGGFPVCFSFHSQFEYPQVGWARIDLIDLRPNPNPDTEFCYVAKDGEKYTCY